MWEKAIAMMGAKVRVQERKEDEEMEIMSIRSLWIFAEKRKQEMGLWIYKAILFLDARQHNMLCF